MRLGNSLSLKVSVNKPSKSRRIPISLVFLPLFGLYFRISLQIVLLHLLRVYPLDNMRSNTLSKAVNQPLLSFLNSAAIWRAPSTCGQTLRVAVALLSSKVHVTRPLDLSILEESSWRTKAISVFNCLYQCRGRS